MQTTTATRRGRPSTGQWRFLIDSREAAQLSQLRLAKKTGLHQAQISLWEQGTRPPDFKQQKLLSQALNIPLQTLAVEVVNFFKEKTT